MANITALSNLRLALAERPDVLLAQELWASKAQVKAEAKSFGYAVAVSMEEPCLAAVFYLPGLGQEVDLLFAGEWGRRVAAANISLGNGYGCLTASAYGYTGPTAGQQEELSCTLVQVLELFRSRGRGRPWWEATSTRSWPTCRLLSCCSVQGGPTGASSQHARRPTRPPAEGKIRSGCPVRCRCGSKKSA